MLGKNNYWDGDKIIDQIINLTTRIFLYAFCNCQAFFAFGNISNHACYAKNAFLAKKINLDVSGKQLWIRDEFNDIIQ